MADDPAPSGAMPDPDATSGQEPQHDQQQQTADELGDAGKRALAEMRRQNRDMQTQRDELAQRLKAIEDADKTDLERSTGRVSELESELEQSRAENAALKQEAMARTAAADAGIAQHWQRLHGATPDELKADAEALAAEIDGGRPPGTSSAELGAGPRPTPATGNEGFNQLIRQRARR